MSKQPKPQTPKIEIRPIAERAYHAAFEVRSGKKSYEEYRADVLNRLNRASEEVVRNAEYGTLSERAGNIVSDVAKLTQNMRLDLLVKYAAKAERGAAVLDAISDQLTPEERNRVEEILNS